MHSGLRRALGAATAVAGAVALSLLPAATAWAAGGDVTVTGAGSTWSQIALDQWRADVAHYGLNINYSGVGSSAGRNFYIINQVDFAATEIPFQPDEVRRLRAEGKSFQYLPDVAGGTSLMYNLRDASGRAVNGLRLSKETLGGIFTGTITSWDAPQVKADNPGLNLPHQAITPVLRSDGSGTSAQFSSYLLHETPSAWAKFTASQGVPDAATSYWPTFGNSVAQKGSDGVANYVANDSTGVGSIGYVEAGYAIERNRPVAFIRNASGAYVLPTAHAVSVALTRATLNGDQTQNLGAVYTNPSPDAYPISSYSYMVTPTSGIDPQKGRVLGAYMLYFACAGQQKAAVLGYSPLPPNLVKVVFSAVKRIPGAPTPPPLSRCANPTIPGAVDGGVPGLTAGTGSAAPPGSGGGATSGHAPQGNLASPGTPSLSGSLGHPAPTTAGGLTPAGTVPAGANGLAGTSTNGLQTSAYAPAQNVSLVVPTAAGGSASYPALAALLAVLLPALLAGPALGTVRQVRRRAPGSMERVRGAGTAVIGRLGGGSRRAQG
ncbi:phosphate ABC transporter phosphate-binding protein [Phycicoccus badiiscoriae]|uniref:Phosphate ABC transporter phosphate-binding protein n=1 Tax=Pedococcus badiiscoriae TaxID=642776 RepID=A0A852WKN3_9MICO|nr:phosphate ABC transporter phosphate-binding protein [Pedococcus badiiscoriae]